MTNVTAIILHFRDASSTSLCMASLQLEQVAGVVLVDNSADNGRSLIDLRARLPAGLRVDIIEPGVNLGFAAGINHAMRHVEKHYRERPVLLINSDAVLASGSLHIMLSLQAHHGVCLVAPWIDGPTGLVPATVYYRHLAGTITSAPGRGAHHRVLGGACLLLHPALCTSPVFDETFFFYGDDIEFGYRLGRAGIALVDAPSATVIHEGSKGSVNGSLFYEYHMARAHLLLVRKLGHGIVMQVMMVMARVLALAARATLRVARYRSLRAWRGLGMAMWDVTNGQVRTLTPAAEQT